MLNQNVAIVAALLPLVGSIAYARDTLKGTTQPNKVSWALWTAAPMIAFAAELTQHAALRVSLLTLTIGLGNLAILVASFTNRQAYWETTRFDVACGLISAIALLLWAVTGKGDLAIMLCILSDVLASIPTLRKARIDPDSESASVYVVCMFASLLSLATITEWNFANYGFPLYYMLIDMTLSSFILLPRLRGAVQTLLNFGRTVEGAVETEEFD